MEKTPSGFIGFIARGSLVKQILVGLVAGIILAVVSTPAAAAVGLLGTLFVGALKAVGKLAIVFGAIEGLMAAAEATGIIDNVADVAYGVAKDFIGNYLEGAKGEDLGDALGTSMYSYYSLAGSAGGAAVLKTSQVEGFQEVMAGVENDIYIYPGVGHAFANPSGARYAPNETVDAWQKTLAFLETNLKK